MEHSAGILLYRWHEERLQVLLVHPGGPYWQHRDKGWWSIPKGKVEEGENPFSTAIREFSEELGEPLFRGYDDRESDYTALGTVRQSKAKNVSVWARERDYDPSELKSNVFRMEYPAGSGEYIDCPEIDRAAWFNLEQDAYETILPGQRRMLFLLAKQIGWKGAVYGEEEI